RGSRVRRGLAHHRPVRVPGGDNRDGPGAGSGPARRSRGPFHPAHPGDADPADDRDARRRRDRLPAHLRLGRGAARIDHAPLWYGPAGDPQQRHGCLLGTGRPRRLGVDAAPVPHPAGRHPVDAGRTIRGRPRRWRRRLADVRRPHAADAAAHDPRGGHAAGNRGADHVRPGLRPDPRRSRDLNTAHLDLWLPDVLPVPADRLRRGDAVHGGARRPARRGVRGRADAEAGPMTRDRVGRLAWAVAALTAILFAVAPLAWMVLTSLKSNREITQDTSLVPAALTSANYVSLFSGREFGAYLTNSVIVTALSVTIALLLGTQAAYVLARFRLRGGLHCNVSSSLLMVRLLPPVVIIIP